MIAGRTIAAASAALAVVGCGGSSKPAVAHGPPNPCIKPARVALARALGIAPAGIRAARMTANTASPQCLFTARLGSGARVTVTVIDDTGPSPFFILSRAATEDGQVFSVKPLHPPPLAINGLGQMSDWFFDYDNLQSTDCRALITVSVAWAHSTQRMQRAIAIAVTRPYMHTPTSQKAINSLCKDYP